MGDSGSKGNRQHPGRRRQKTSSHSGRQRPRMSERSMGETYETMPDNDRPNIVLDDYQHHLESMDWEMAASEHPGTTSSEMGSYLENSTDCAITDEANNSWLVVHQHHRSYSNESNQTSEGPCLSIPSDGKPDWVYGAVEKETDLPIIEHDHQQILSDLSHPKSKSFYQPFEEAASSSEEVAYQEHMENYSIQNVNSSLATRSSGTPEFALSPYTTYDGPEASWNPLQHRVPRYSPGYTVFAPLSPSESLVNGTPTSSPGDSKYPLTRKRSPRSPTSVKSGKGKSKGTLEWEHTVVRKGGLERVFEHAQVESSQKPSGCRKGKLDPETAARARRVRKLGACWPCWILKVPCSDDKICNRCRKQISKCSPTAEQFCSRNGFVDYEETFFSGKIAYLHSHLQRYKIKELINEHTSHFTNTALDVEVRTGQYFEPMKLFAHFFQCKDNELLQLHHVAAAAEYPRSQLVCRYSAPIGLMAFSTSDMKDLCKDHIEKMIRNPHYALQTTAGDPNQISYLILEAIVTYFFATNMPLLRKALMLHACHYFMAQLLTFTEETAELVHRIVDPYGVLEDGYLSSRLLNRQIKYAMHKLHQEIMKDVLEGLEKLMRSRTKDSWGPSFCIILVLCLCIDGLQTAADTFVVCDIEKSKGEGSTSEYTRAQSTAACQDLDDYPFRQSTSLFHDIYRSHRENGGAREGFNPLRAAHDEVTDDLDKKTVTLVRGIRYILNSHYSEIGQLSKRSTLVNTTNSITPADIKANHCGRLVSKFLESFSPTQI